MSLTPVTQNFASLTRRVFRDCVVFSCGASLRFTSSKCFHAGTRRRENVRVCPALYLPINHLNMTNFYVTRIKLMGPHVYVPVVGNLFQLCFVRSCVGESFLSDRSSVNRRSCQEFPPFFLPRCTVARAERIPAQYAAKHFPSPTSWRTTSACTRGRSLSDATCAGLASPSLIFSSAIPNIMKVGWFGFDSRTGVRKIGSMIQGVPVAALWIRIRIGSACCNFVDPCSEFGSRSTQLKIGKKLADLQNNVLRFFQNSYRNVAVWNCSDPDPNRGKSRNLDPNIMNLDPQHWCAVWIHFQTCLGLKICEYMPGCRRLFPLIRRYLYLISLLSWITGVFGLKCINKFACLVCDYCFLYILVCVKKTCTAELSWKSCDIHLYA